MKSLLDRIRHVVGLIRHPNLEPVSRYQHRLDQVNRLESVKRQSTDQQLRDDAEKIRRQVQSSKQNCANALVVEAFAVFREAIDRTLGMRPFDVQILAALALFDGRCVEMQTGEGKTLVAVLPVSLRAMMGHGFHVLTFNDYLASRDAAWMAPAYRFLGLRVGSIEQDMPSDERRKRYACDVTYVTAKEAGFDFLRDQLVTEPADRVQRPLSCALVDEADSILIDEARVPLVLAGQVEQDAEDLVRYAELVRSLRRNVDFTIHKGFRNVSLTDRGLTRLEREFHCTLHSDANVDRLTRINLALQAETLLERDRDYLVRGDGIALIDEFTGRVAENRRWPWGLQAAIEAKERVTIQPQGRILNSITLQHFVARYDHLSGMTGTACEAAEELHNFYDLRVVVVPTNRTCIRIDRPDQIFSTKGRRDEAIVGEIVREHQLGRPVLVGTSSVEESESLAARLAEAEIAYDVLNARNDHLEAEIVAEAGDLNAVTISTNMAGRGTDIRLGGSDQRQRDRVLQLGGLMVFGTNRHESRRIDNQLRGRAGRQGDPGESRFLISLEDDLIKRHGIGELFAAQNTENLGDDASVARRIAHVQRVVEGESFEIRRTLRKYSFLVEQQRQLLQGQRDKVLFEEGFESVVEREDHQTWQRLVSEHGAAIVAKAERQIKLFHIDECWMEHLLHIADVRESIHLASMGGFNAFDEFNRHINQGFRTMQNSIDSRVVETMKTVQFTSDGVDLAAHGMARPSSTWTFMINDNPMGDVLERLSRGIRRMFRQ